MAHGKRRDDALDKTSMRIDFRCPNCAVKVSIGISAQARVKSRANISTNPLLEIKILRMALSGKTTKEIAQALNLDSGVVRYCRDLRICL